jgi:hypothetical protein
MMPLPSVWAILTTDELAGLQNGGMFREDRMRKSGLGPLFLRLSQWWLTARSDWAKKSPVKSTGLM